MKKIVLICTALVLALGALGVGYAAWTDDVTVTGTVETGSLDLTVERVDGDYIWKDLVLETLVWDHWVFDYTVPGYIDEVAYPENEYKTISKSGGYLGADPDTVVFYFDNLFPFDGATNWIGTSGGGMVASALLHYTGTIPAKIWTDWDISDNIEPYAEVVANVYDTDNVFLGTYTLEELNGVQVHNCYTISFYVVITIPQDNDLMDLSGTMTFKFTAMQWNETPQP